MGDYVAFLCDNVVESQYGKYDFQGVILSNEITIKNDNYNLLTNLVIIKNSLTETLSGKEFKVLLQMSSTQQEGYISTDIILEGALPNEIFTNNNKLILVFPIQVVISSGVQLSFILNIDNINVLEQKYKTELGDAPYVNTNGEILTSGVIIPNENYFNIENLFSRSINSLLIVDQYIDPQSLITMCNKVNKNCFIKLLTLNKYDKQRNLMKRQLFLDNYQMIKDSGFSKIEIRFSPDVHDRYALIEDSELYHFGHSFRDLNKNKASSYEKISTLEDYKKLTSFFEDLWLRSEADKIEIINL